MGTREQRVKQCIKKARLAALIATVIGAGCVAVPQAPAREEGTYRDCKIAFTSDRDGNEEIHIMNSDGSEQKNLTNNGARDAFPSWSPDGKKIAFVSDRDGELDIYIMNADGSKQKKVTRSVDNIFGPSWSPDGKRIAFVCDKRMGYQIHVINADGGEHKNLTSRYSQFGIFSWSPDGQSIVFEKDGQIYLVNADGSGERKLTDKPGFQLFPSWSPDGKRIALLLQTDAKRLDIYVINPDGRELKNLTNSPTYSHYAPWPFPLPGSVLFPWSPEGDKIAFMILTRQNTDGPGTDIYVMNADGSEQKRLTDTGDNGNPLWSPDGKKIAFTSGRDGYAAIYIMNPDGSDQKRLTDAPGNDYLPSWSPFLNATIETDE